MNLKNLNQIVVESSEYKEIREGLNAYLERFWGKV